MVSPTSRALSAIVKTSPELRSNNSMRGSIVIPALDERNNKSPVLPTRTGVPTRRRFAAAGSDRGLGVPPSADIS